MLANLFTKSSFSLISVVSPFTLITKKELARPLPYANMLILLPLSSSGEMEDKRDAKPPYRDAVYMLPQRFAQRRDGFTFDWYADLAKVMNDFSRTLSVREAA